MNSLPTTDELPDADVVIYDGNCQFCQKQVARLYRLDGKGRLAFVSLHDPAARRFAGSLTHEQLMDRMYVVTRDGRQYGGAESLRYLSRRLPKLWWLAPLLHIPLSLPIWSFLYGQVAKRRYQWNRKECDGDACRVHFEKK